MANQAVHGETNFHVGDTIRVHYRLIEKEKVAGKAKREVKEEVRERIQVFEGIVMQIRGRGNGTSFTVRRIGAANIGIERVFPLISPWIKTIEVKHEGKVRRAKIYYLREKVGKEATSVKDKFSKGKKTVKKTAKSVAKEVKKEVPPKVEEKAPTEVVEKK